MTTREHAARDDKAHDDSPILAEANRQVREPINRAEALLRRGEARARLASRRGEEYVRTHTWRSLAGAALAGVLAGICLMRHGGRR